MTILESYLGKTIRIDDKTAQFTTDIGYREIVRLVKILNSSLITEDEATGAAVVDVVNFLPLALFHILRLLTDMDMTKYSEGAQDLYSIVDDVEKSPDRDQIMQIVARVKELADVDAQYRIKEIEGKNSVAAQFKGLIRLMLGSDDGKNTGMVRSMLTDLFIKMEREGKGNGKQSASNQLVDLSEFKAKRDR